MHYRIVVRVSLCRPLLPPETALAAKPDVVRERRKPRALDSQGISYTCLIEPRL